SLIKFMTDGILLAETQGDGWLNAYDTIILDEAHERSLNIDFLLGYLKRLLAKRRDLKLIVTSATIDTSRFAQHFGDAPVVEVEGRAYPVEVRWRGAPERSDTTLTEQLMAAADEITQNDPRGDVLVFLPGEREIRDAHLALSRRKYRETEVLALYARLSAAEQDRVFKPGPQRRIVLATNVAETSLTVPRIRYVIDTGTARVKRYSPRNQLERLHIEPISQAAADQRKGRCGRLGPGVCVRLYAEDDFAQRPRYTEPEILRSSLAGVILRMLALKLGDPLDFPFVEPPSERAIADGYRRLAELGAVAPLSMRSSMTTEDGQMAIHGRTSPFPMRSSMIAEDQAAAIHGGTSPLPMRSSMTAEDQAAAIHGRTSQFKLTDIGRTLAKLPIDVALGRMLVEAQRLGCLREQLILAAFLSIQDPRERPADARAQADAAHAEFADPKSDFIGVLKLWAAYTHEHEELTQSKLRDWCHAHFLSFMRMREWRELHRQLLLTIDELGWSLSGKGTGFKVATQRQHHPHPNPPLEGEGLGAQAHEAIHRCLLSGWPTQVGFKDERGQYRGTRERKFSIFPGSALAKSPPQWLLAGQILDVQKVYALQCARI
ncbi:MAG: helicase-related protein, partial [Dokdonella sp.]